MQLITKRKKISNKDIELVKNLYKPCKIAVEYLGNKQGMLLSIEKVSKLCKEHEKQTGIHYDIYFYTRPDIYFCKPLLINSFINQYTDTDLNNVNLPEKYIFCANSCFNRLQVMDPRYIPESDLVWFSNFSMNTCPIIQSKSDNLCIAMNYVYANHFYIERCETQDFKCKFSIKPYLYKLLPYFLVQKKMEKYKRKGFKNV